MENEELITPAQAAKMLAVSVMTVRNYELAGKLKCAKTLGGHRRYRLAEIEKLLKIDESKLS